MKKKVSRQLGLVSALAVVGLALAACGGGVNATASSSASVDERLRFNHGGKDMSGILSAGASFGTGAAGTDHTEPKRKREKEARARLAPRGLLFSLSLCDQFSNASVTHRPG